VTSATAASTCRPPHGVKHDLRSDDLLAECRQRRFAPTVKSSLRNTAAQKADPKSTQLARSPPTLEPLPVPVA
jgi:hypothetical protein